MAYLPSQDEIAEFSTTGSFARFAVAEGESEREPTLLIKAPTLQLKYLLQDARLDLRVVDAGHNELAYAVKIPDDPENPSYAWSVVESERELECLTALVAKPRCVVHLFNELAIAVASTEAELDLGQAREFISTGTVRTGPSTTDKAVSELLDLAVSEGLGPDVCVDASAVVTWHLTHNHFYTNSDAAISFSLLSEDEGAQQEVLAQWLMDALSPLGAIRSPQLQSTPPRELCDVLVTYPGSDILVESKALGVLRGDQLPSRNQLARTTAKHVAKANRQLAGALRQLALGMGVTDPVRGRELGLSGKRSAHAIVLVPDLELLAGVRDLGPAGLADFFKKTGSFLHILDVPELVRVVHAAGMLAHHGRSISRIQAFDAHLFNRFEAALKHEDPYFTFLLKIEPETKAGGF